jgi:hypothetical protein
VGKSTRRPAGADDTGADHAKAANIAHALILRRVRSRS